MALISQKASSLKILWEIFQLEILHKTRLLTTLDLIEILRMD